MNEEIIVQEHFEEEVEVMDTPVPPAQYYCEEQGMWIPYSEEQLQECYAPIP